MRLSMLDMRLVDAFGCWWMRLVDAFGGCVWWMRLVDALAMGCVSVYACAFELFEGLVKDYGVCVWTYAFALEICVWRMRWRYAFGDMRLDFCYCP